MVSITFSVDEITKSEMDKFSWINWSELARTIFLDKVKKQEALDALDKMMKKSGFTDKDVEEISKKSKHARLQQLKSRGIL